VKGSGTSAFTASATIPGSDISGNISGNAGNVTGTVAVANGGTGATTLTGYVKGSGTSAMTASATIPNTDITGLGTMSTQAANNVAITGGAIDGTIVGGTTPAAGTFTSVTMTSGTITTAPTNGNDIVNKTYADSIATGINFHQSCRLATTTALPSCTYNNGTSGVGATLTATANGALSVDTTAVVATNRILVKNQVNQAHNGVYTVTQVGDGSNPFILTRATDFDTTGTGVDQIDAGDFFLITAGSTLANTSWVQQTPLPITVGTTAIVFTQFAAPVTYSAGTGLNLSPATTFNISNTGVTSGSYGTSSSVPTIGVNAQGQITSASNTSIAIGASQVTSGTLAVARGGTGVSTTPTNGQLLIGNGTDYTLATLTQGTGITITNGSGTITIASSGGSMVYPGAGIPNSTGSSWGTSYSTTGSGTVVALATSPSLNSPTFVTPVLGTPSSGTLTSCTGLPVSTGISGLGTGVATALSNNANATGGFTTIDGTATLTNKTLTSPVISTISNTGTLTLPTSTDTLVGRATTDTLTNKRVTPRVSTTASSATPTINTDTVDQYGLTAQTVDITSFSTNLSGTPTDGQKLWIYIVGTAARAITWGGSFESSTVSLPSTTVSTNRLDVGFVWNAATSKWRCVASA
jgi:hypothetical protein